MPKVSFWADDAQYAAILERCEEEGVTRNAVVKEAVAIYLGTTDPKPKKKQLPEYEGVGKISRFTIAIPEPWLWKLNLMAVEQSTPKRKTSGAAIAREAIRVFLGEPLPPKIERAPRDRELTSAILLEEHVEKFSEMRNLRSQPKERELTWGEKVLENPDQIFQVSDCFVPGCKEHDCGFHRHAGKDLLLRAAKYMPKKDT